MNETRSLILFALLQCADGILTYYGINYTPAGISYEANILVAAIMQKVGIAAGLTALKLISVMLGLTLYRFRNSRIFGMEPAIYMFWPLNIVMAIVLISHFMALEALANASG